MHDRLLALVFAVVVPFALAACDFTEGERGVLSFDDLSTGVTGVDRPLQVGAVTRIQVTCEACGADAQVTSATSLSPEVVEVLGMSGAEVVVQGVSEGEARLEFTLDEAGTDSLLVQVRVATSATVRLSPWGDETPLPPVLWSSGFAALSGSEFQVRAFPKDVDGQRLSGYGGITWSVSNDASIDAVEGRRDDRVAVQVSESPEQGELTIATSTGEEVRVEIVEMSDVDTLELAYLQDNGDPRILRAGDTLEIPASELAVLQLVARDVAGTYISGAGDSLASLALDEGAAGAVTDVLLELVNGLEGADPTDVDATRRFYERAFVLQAIGEPGATGELDFSWGGHELQLGVTVGPGAP